MGEAIDIRAIHESRLGTDLRDEESTALGAVMRVHALNDGEVLVTEGESDGALYLLAQGTLDVSRREGDSSAHLHTMHEGELAGVRGLLGEGRRSSTLRARGPVIAYSLTREALESLLDDHPRTVYKVMRSITRIAYDVLADLGGQLEQLTNYVTKQHGRY